MRQVILILAALTFVTGCGSDSDESGSSAATTSAATTTGSTTKQTTLTGVETEYKIEPSSKKVPLGFLKLVGVNKGKTTHILEIEGPGSENETADIPPGQTKSLELNLRTPGEYELYCPIDDHKAKGMVTKIKVG